MKVKKGNKLYCRKAVVVLVAVSYSNCLVLPRNEREVILIICCCLFSGQFSEMSISQCRIGIMGMSLLYSKI